MTTPSLIVALLLAAGLFFALLAIARLRQRRLFAATRAATGGCVCLALTALAFALALNLYSYHRFTWEQPVARLSFEQIGPQRFRVRLDTTAAPARDFLLSGNQWQLDARVLKWQPLATLLGFDAVYRLDRISGRHSRIEAARRLPDTVYDLSEPRGLDVWQSAQYLPGWLNPVDARFGSATYLPMVDGARYSVSLSQTGGLVARPENAAARSAIADW